MKRITAVIPAYNAEETIGEVVKKCLLHCDKVFVVDDGSRDNTAQVAQDSGAKVYKLIQNHGTGFATAFGLNGVWDSEVVVTIDSDGQHDPSEMLTVCVPILNDKADLVIGSRFLEGSETNIRSYRKLGIDIITEFYNWGHVPITDAQCCFRAFKGDRLQKILPQTHRFGFSTEMLIRARKEKMRIMEVPITCYYRGLEHDSSMNPIKHGVSVLVDTILWRVRLMN